MANRAGRFPSSIETISRERSTGSDHARRRRGAAPHHRHLRRTAGERRLLDPGAAAAAGEAHGDFDDPGICRRYCGDAARTPGSILTFFPFANAGSFHGVTLCVRDVAPTARGLGDVLGYGRFGEEADPEGARTRFVSAVGGPGAAVDLLVPDDPAPARQGTGTIHHVVFRVENDDVERGWQERLQKAGFDVTPVIDRQYFNAIYFREPGGVLFEIATDPPGFAHDESEATMGEMMMLPDQYEAHRAEIERVVPPLDVAPWRS